MNDSVSNNMSHTINFMKGFRRGITNLYFSKFLYHRYFDDTESIFIHTPKSAGTSIAKALYGHDPRHVKLYNYQIRNAEKFNKYYKFSFVRDPLTRIASAYFYCRKIVHKLDSRHPLKFIENYESFEKFVLLGLNSQIKNHYFLGLQTNYLLDNRGTIDSLDFIGKFENLYHDFSYVADKLGVNVQLGHDKKGEVRNYEELYSNVMLNKLKEIYYEDYILLDY